MTTTLQTPFNSTQVEILKLFSQGLTDAQLEELRQLLITFRFKILDEQVQKTAKKKGLSLKEIDAVSKEHYRKSKLEDSKNKS